VFFDSTDIMSTDDQPKPDAMAALRARFEAQSSRAQAYYNVMHEARRIAGSIEAANDWMNAPLAAFEGKTPAQMVNEGREEQVLAHLRAQKS
jgi:uncharacterized protein (DUF2384 family)